MNKFAVTIMKIFRARGVEANGRLSKLELLDEFCRVHPNPDSLNKGLEELYHSTFLDSEDDKEGPYILMPDGYVALDAFK